LSSSRHIGEVADASSVLKEYEKINHSREKHVICVTYVIFVTKSHKEKRAASEIRAF
jgi:hypothetical protein